MKILGIRLEPSHERYAMRKNKIKEKRRDTRSRLDFRTSSFCQVYFAYFSRNIKKKRELNWNRGHGFILAPLFPRADKNLYREDGVHESI